MSQALLFPCVLSTHYPPTPPVFPATLFLIVSFVLLFRFSSNSSYSNLSRSLSPLLGSLSFAFSLLLVIPVFLFSLYCLQPAGFSAPLSPPLICHTPPASFFPPLFLCKISDPCSLPLKERLWFLCKIFHLPPAIFDMRWSVFMSTVQSRNVCLSVCVTLFVLGNL